MTSSAPEVIKTDHPEINCVKDVCLSTLSSESGAKRAIVLASVVSIKAELYDIFP